MNALEATGLGKRYGQAWALRDCTLAVPTGAVTALVGSNGAGKTTLLRLSAGLLTPSAGEVRIAGRRLTRRESDISRVAFVAQDKPLFRTFTVSETLRFARLTNPGFDTASATKQLHHYAIPLTQRIGRLASGQRTLVALVLALCKRAELVLLDEPLADLDPLARIEVMGALLAATVETGATVVLSSHILADLTDTCDHLLLLSQGRLQLAGGFDELTRTHRVLTGPPGLADELQRDPSAVVHMTRTDRQTTAVIRVGGPGGRWGSESEPNLEELVLAYLRNPEATRLPAPVLVPPRTGAEATA